MSMSVRMVAATLTHAGDKQTGWWDDEVTWIFVLSPSTFGFVE